MTNILIISNGHGEDYSGSIIGNNLKKRGHTVDSFPLVGSGFSYLNTGIKVMGKTKIFSTGGIGYTSIAGRLTEIIEGQILYLLGRILTLLRIVRNYDLVIVIGDIVPVIAAWLTRKSFVVYLVAYSSHYEGKLRLPWPCSSLLTSSKVLKIYARDILTSEDLTNQLSREVQFVGNPFMDPIFAHPEFHSANEYRLGILPGSRLPELDHNLELILRVIDNLIWVDNSENKLEIDMALVNTLGDERLFNIADKYGWNIFSDADQYKLIKNNKTINIYRNAFVKVLKSSDLLLSMSGTAAEQAIGLGKPVLQLPGFGPQFTKSFADAQRRLLGPNIFCADGKVGSKYNIEQTSLLIVKLIKEFKNKKNFQDVCIKEAKIRLGTAGGGIRIADQISDLLKS